MCFMFLKYLCLKCFHSDGCVVSPSMGTRMDGCDGVEEETSTLRRNHLTRGVSVQEGCPRSDLVVSRVPRKENDHNRLCFMYYLKTGYLHSPSNGPRRSFQNFPPSSIPVREKAETSNDTQRCVTDLYTTTEILVLPSVV